MSVCAVKASVCLKSSTSPLNPTVRDEMRRDRIEIQTLPPSDHYAYLLLPKKQS